MGDEESDYDPWDPTREKVEKDLEESHIYMIEVKQFLDMGKTQEYAAKAAFNVACSRLSVCGGRAKTRGERAGKEGAGKKALARSPSSPLVFFRARPAFSLFPTNREPGTGQP